MQRSSGRTMKFLATRLASLFLSPLQQLKAALVKGSQGEPRHMVLVESLSLGNRRQLFLIDCDKQRFLVGAGADRVGTLVAIPEIIAPGAAVLTPTLRPATRAQADWRKPDWMSDSPVGAASTGGLQLVKRETALRIKATRDGHAEAVRTQW